MLFYAAALLSFALCAGTISRFPRFFFSRMSRLFSYLAAATLLHRQGMLPVAVDAAAGATLPLRGNDIKTPSSFIKIAPPAQTGLVSLGRAYDCFGR
jgi:hypothetical protein